MWRSYLLAFGLTLAVEVPAYTLALVGVRLCGPVRALGLALAVNVATHPALWWGLTATGPAPLWPAEAAVTLVEAGLLWLVLRRDAGLLLLLSLGTNAASLLVGALVVG